MFWTGLILWAILLRETSCLIAYDCSSSDINTTVISRREIAPCSSDNSQYLSKKIKIQVLQRNEIKQQHVMSCLVEVTRLITYCGMHSHASLVDKGLSTYVHPLGAQECKNLHHQKYIVLYDNYIGYIIMNGTTTADITLHGRIDTDGTCYGKSFYDNGISWKNVVVQATVKITLMDYFANIRLETNEIVLKSGVICSYLKGYCMDTVYGETTWNTVNLVACNELSELYRGLSTIVTELKTKKEYLVVDQSNKVFALELKQTTQQCSKYIWQTEHPRILVLSIETQVPQPASRFSKNVDMTSYVNSKFLYVEQSYKRGLHEMYIDTIKRRCELKREILQNKLSMAPLSPTTIGSIIGETEGYVGYVMGEVIYLRRCIPKTVTLRKTDKCYHELPIIVANQSKFLAPLTRIIQDTAEEINCSTLMVPLYYLQGMWVGLTPDPIIRQPPILLTPDGENELKFTPIQPLGAEGIYTENAIDNSQNTLRFDVERKAVENSGLRFRV